MYAQQFKKPPSDYCGTAIPKTAPGCAEPPAPEPPLPPAKRRVCTDEFVILAVAFAVMSGGSDKNMLLLLALIFILL